MLFPRFCISCRRAFCFTEYRVADSLFCQFMEKLDKRIDKRIDSTFKRIESTSCNRVESCGNILPQNESSHGSENFPNKEEIQASA